MKFEMEVDELSSALKACLYLSNLPPSNVSSKETESTINRSSTEEDKGKAKKESKKKNTIETRESKDTTGSTAAMPSATKPSYDRWSLLEESTLEYGVFGKSSASITQTNTTSSPFFLTTAINYTNGPAHMGHAYEATTSDAIARYRRVRDGEENVYFITGSDEHGQKIANTASAEGKQPIEICDKYVTGFQCLNQRILISNNDYIRTTSTRHKQTAHKLWNRCASNLNPTTNESDIYLSTYTGWYNVREETFVTESDAKLADYKDVTSGQPLKQVQEESYFFRMSRYHDALVKHISDNPNFIRPEQHRNNILSRLNADRLRDLSVSRTTFDWGIPVPDGFQKGHVMYVWFDALTNYLTGVDCLDVMTSSSDLTHFWPANVHIIGKDILWFHTVIWPCILLSANLPLPKTVFAHGFVNDKEGKKMSKSLGNVVDPHDMLDQYTVDTFRWYLCKEAPYGGELSFSEDSLRDMHNADLCDTLGNLVHRATNLCQSYCDGVLPDVSPDSKRAVLDFNALINTYRQKMDSYELEAGASLVIQAYRDVNGYLTAREPWKMKGDALETERQIVVRATLEAVYALAHLLVPFLPNGASMIFDKLNTPPKKTLGDLDSNMRNLTCGTKISIGPVLYSKILSKEEEEAKKSKNKGSKSAKESHAEAQKRKKEKRAREIAASNSGRQAKEGDNANQSNFTKIDIRVGKIVKVWNHPEADKLFCEEIDVGEENGGVREIASGLRPHYSLDELKERLVLVVCNLKAAKIVGFTSNGMVLAAKSTDGTKVELIDPPKDSVVGERVYIDDLDGEPFSPAQVKKKKLFDVVAKGLTTGHNGVAIWDGKEIRTKTGTCAAASLVGAPIS
mmetsp:Transcript_13862/g.19854  ORF Transcript_13862/g.19854 Transcript_13862/m.19854 type:complete len:853 (+) Transcript_13862:182-2740(+)|eukprot:CAMPEP_0184864218 /NCGR_PEP_ID=MMETSP0580-20130426/14139_1 /TAXON_ID=1118495 /ORGANISM="Dactyliosolen fragilissimus" /LENGTH=852 /DNA_ID=CAMNT_0027362911 /DNA_START=76 /DNA_END=2634 /DNA_ORIENTATION=+